MFEYEMFMPRAYCMLNDPTLVALYAISNFIIWIAYMSIGIDYLKAYSRNSLALTGSVTIFLGCAFIVTCGLGHLVNVIMIWFPTYYFQVMWDCITALISSSAAVWLRLATRDSKRAGSK